VNLSHLGPAGHALPSHLHTRLHQQLLQQPALAAVDQLTAAAAAELAALLLLLVMKAP
jgi:hypothetical protein